MNTDDILKAFEIKEYSWPTLYYLESELDLQFESVKTLMIEQDRFIKGRRLLLQTTMDQNELLNSNASEYEKAQYEWHYFGPQQEALDELEVVLRNGGVLTVFAVFESKLKRLCESLEEITNTKKRSKVIGKTDIDRSINYIELTLGVTVPGKDKLHEIQKYKVVRNKVAHQDRRVEPKDVNDIKRLPGIVVDGVKGNEKLSIKDMAFNDTLMNLMKAFAKELFECVDEAASKIKNWN